MILKQRKDDFGGISIDELHHIQEKLLELLLEFDNICKKHDITYYLDGGSVIGAMRHAGFVPWDDDVDILIKRSEFDKFIRIIDDELKDRPNRLFSYFGREASHHRSFARYVDTATLHAVRNTITETNYPPGIFIDLFILDPVPSNALLKHCHLLESSEEWFHKRLNGVVGRMPYWKYLWYELWEHKFGEDAVFNHFDNLLSKYTDNEASYYVPRNGFNYAVYTSDVFQEPRYVEFEGHFLPVPTKPEKYLRAHYSIDWFKMPPPELQYSTHYTLAGIGISANEFQNVIPYTKHQHRVFNAQIKRHRLQVRRARPARKTKRLMAELQAVCDGQELQLLYDDASQEKIKRLYETDDYSTLGRILEPYYSKQLDSTYLAQGIKLEIPSLILRIGLEVLIANDRIFDAQRILNLYQDRVAVGIEDIGSAIDLAIDQEIVEQDDPTQSKPIIPKNNIVVPNASPSTRDDAVMDKALELLREFDDVCANHNLNYSLTGNVLIDAARSGSVTGTYGGISIIMPLADYRRLIYSSISLPPHRRIENAANNPFYPDNSIRYVATNTTNVKFTNPWFRVQGIYITIRPLGALPLSKRRKNLQRHLRRYVQLTSMLPSFLRGLGKPLALLHRNLLLQQLRAEREDELHITLKVGFRRIRIPIGNSNELNYEKIHFSGHNYPIFRGLIDGLHELAPWFSFVNLTDKFASATRVVNVNVPYEKYLSKISPKLLNKLYYNAIQSHRLLQHIRRAQRSRFSHHKHLRDVAYRFYKYKMWKVYEDRSEEVWLAMSQGNLAKLDEELGEYIENFNYFLQRGKLLIGHPLAFTAYLQLLKHQGHIGFYKYIITRVNNKL